MSNDSVSVSKVRDAVLAESANWDAGCQAAPAAWEALRDFAISIGIKVTLEDQYQASVKRMEQESWS